jgi:hypothetical protein
MFKRINLLLLIVLSVMTVAPARALECSPNSSIILSNGGQDSSTYKFKTSGEYNVQTEVLGHLFKVFHTDCLLFPSDLQKGDTSLGTSKLPTNAKVTGMKLGGYNNGGKTTNIAISTYINNTDATSIPYSFLQGFNSYDDINKLCNGNQYTNANNTDCKFPDGTSSTNRLTLLDLPFIKPFIYSGGNVALVLDMYCGGTALSDIPMDFYYNTATASDGSTVIRSGSFAYSLSTLPAVAIKYYTNDLRGTFTDLTGAPIVESVSGKTVDETGPYVRLVDLTDNNKVIGIGKVHPAADGFFSFINLDPTHKYHLSAASYSYGYIEKDVTFTAKNGSLDYADDILATIKMEKSDVVTGLNAVGANGGMTILGSKSSITVIANGNSKVAVYDVTGRLVRQADVVAGSNSIDDLVPGIYIVNHVKVAVK